MALTLPPPLPELSRKAAIIGIGETDYRADYRAERARAPGYEKPSPEMLSKLAFDRALADSGLKRSDIDGVAVSFTYGGSAPEEMATLLGLKPRYAVTNGNIMAGPLPRVCADIAAGKADCVAMIYAVTSRAIGRQYGGSTYGGGEGSQNTPSSYYYYHPWGWSSQAAHWALMFRHYAAQYGVGEEDLASVAIQVRNHAATNRNAVMQNPLTVADYTASRYIVRPMRLFDMCLVNDGAVCLIVRRADMAKENAKSPVLVAGWGESKVSHSTMHAMVRERLCPQMQDAGRQALEMAGVRFSDIGHFEGYDVSTIHLVNQVEGYGFAARGEGIAFCQGGQMTHGGRIPTNLSGGNLSGSYMHGWSQIAEVVRQLRHEAGVRQIAGLRYSLSALTQTDQTHPIIFEGTVGR